LRTYQVGRRIEPAAIFDIFAGRPAGLRIRAGSAFSEPHAELDVYP